LTFESNIVINWIFLDGACWDVVHMLLRFTSTIKDLLD
jgi:hypothetical protein